MRTSEDVAEDIPRCAFGGFGEVVHIVHIVLNREDLFDIKLLCALVVTR